MRFPSLRKPSIPEAASSPRYPQSAGPFTFKLQNACPLRKPKTAKQPPAPRCDLRLPTPRQAAISSTVQHRPTTLMRLHIKCPNCDRPAKAVDVRQISKLVSEITYLCPNAGCRGIFIFSAEVLRWLSVPLHLDPEITIPLSRTAGPRKRTTKGQTPAVAAPPLISGVQGSSPPVAAQADPTAETDGDTAKLPDLGPWSQLLR